MDGVVANQQMLDQDQDQDHQESGLLVVEEDDDDDDDDDLANDSLCYTDYEISEDSDYEESLTCNVCDRYFPTMRLLAQHQQKKRHFGCSACDSLFPSLMALEHHKEEFDHWSDTEEAAFTDDGSDVAASKGAAARSTRTTRGGRGGWSEDEEGDRDEDAISEEHERLLL